MKRKTWLWLVGLAAVLVLGSVGAAYANRSRSTLTIGIYSGSYWGTPTGDCYQVLDDAIARFEAQHPGVQVEYVSGISTDSYSEWLAQQILKGTEPDVFFVLPEDFDLLVSSGALARLDARMDADPSFDRDAYYAPSLSSGVLEGAQYALPYESVPTMMFVNKTLLEAHDIAVPGNNWTWDDFYSICAQVTDVEHHQFGVYGYTWLDALYSNGGSLFSQDGTSCLLTSQPVQASIRFVQRLNELNEGYMVTSRDFDLGNVAFRPFLFSEYRAYQPYPWRVKKYSSFEWECVCMPAGTHGGNVSELRTMLLGISSRSRNPELAWAFAKLLSYDESIQRELYSYSHSISPLRAVAEDDEILSQLHKDIPGNGSGSFSREVIGNIMDHAVTVPRFDGYDQALTMAQTAVSQMLNSGDSVVSPLLEPQREINLFLNKN